VAELMLNHDKHPDQIKAFFNTHSHSDHIVGLLPLIFLCGWAFTEASFDLYVPEDRVANAFHAFSENLFEHPVHNPRLNFRVYEAGEIYDDGCAKITAIPTGHCLPRPSYAFLFEAEGKKVLFSGDLSYGLGDYPQIANEEELDLFVCEMAHFDGEDIAARLETCKAKRLIFNHYQARKPPQIEALAAPGRFPFPISRAKDGDSIEI
jgi:ribonuclease BN (tRNA processing enzyme)